MLIIASIRLSSQYWNLIRKEHHKETNLFKPKNWTCIITSKESNKVILGSIAYETKNDVVKLLIRAVKNVDRLDNMNFYVIKNKYIKIDDEIIRIEIYREEIKFCSNCKMPILFYEEYQRIDSMYFHKRDC